MKKKRQQRFSKAAEFNSKKLAPGEYFDQRTPGLSLRVRSSGYRAWSYLYRNESGRLRRWTIGRADKLSLKDARDKVRNGGDDPATTKREARVAETVGELARKFVEEHAKIRNRRWRRTEATLERYILPRWKNVRVREITRGDVKALLREIPGTTFPNRVRSLLSKLFAFAVAEDIATANPVVGVERKPEARRDRVLTDDEIRAAWATGNLILRLILLTCQRPDDCKGIRRSELDGDTWTIPAERFKTKRAHVVPLTPQVVKLLRSLPQVDGQDRFFAEREGKGLVKVLADAGIPDARPKDLQRTTRSRLSSLGISPDVAERVQGHAIPGVRAAYDKHDYLPEKRAALVRWEAELGRILKRGAKGKVVNIRG